MPYTVQQYAKLFKTQYPDYADMDDGELVQRLIQKYPQLGREIDINTFNTEPDTGPVGAVGRFLKGSIVNPIQGGLSMLGDVAATASPAMYVPGVNDPAFSEEQRRTGVSPAQKEFGEKYITRPMEEQYQKSLEAQDRGAHTEGLARMVAGTVPVAGPAVANWAQGMGEALGTGDVGALAEGTGEALAPKVLPAAARMTGRAGMAVGEAGAAAARNPYVRGMVRQGPKRALQEFPVLKQFHEAGMKAADEARASKGAPQSQLLKQAEELQAGQTAREQFLDRQRAEGLGEAAREVSPRDPNAPMPGTVDKVAQLRQQMALEEAARKVREQASAEAGGSRVMEAAERLGPVRQAAGLKPIAQGLPNRKPAPSLPAPPPSPPPSGPTWSPSAPMSTAGAPPPAVGPVSGPTNVGSAPALPSPPQRLGPLPPPRTNVPPGASSWLDRNWGRENLSMLDEFETPGPTGPTSGQMRAPAPARQSAPSSLPGPSSPPLPKTRADLPPEWRNLLENESVTYFDRPAFGPQLPKPAPPPLPRGPSLPPPGKMVGEGGVLPHIDVDMPASRARIDFENRALREALTDFESRRSGTDRRTSGRASDYSGPERRQRTRRGTPGRPGPQKP